jgi:methionyl-tRNA synthetase
LWEAVKKTEGEIAEKLERAELRDAFRQVFELSSLANKYFQDAEPWRLRTEDPAKAAAVIRDLTFVVRDLAVLIEPYMPEAAGKIASFFGQRLGEAAGGLRWKDIGRPEGIADNGAVKSEMLFTKLEDELVNTLREKYSGSQAERLKGADAKVDNTETAGSGTPNGGMEKTVPPFAAALDLRVAKIEKIERHPKADKLYVINLEVGEGVSGVREERTIVSGLVPFYTEEQLMGKKIIVAYNLKAAKLRGIESKGMLLAAGDHNGAGPDGQELERCEVLDAGDAPTGTRLLPEGEAALSVPPEIGIDLFFSVPIMVKDFVVRSGEKVLCLAGKPVHTAIISDGAVH